MMQKLPFIGLLLILAILTAWIYFNGNSLEGRLNFWQIKLNLSGFKLTDYKKIESKDKKIEQLEAKSSNVSLRLTKFKVSNSQKFIEDKKFLLNSLFEPITSPYPEVLTNIVECPDEFKPKEQTTSLGTTYTLFAGERFNFGICSKDLVKYQAIYGIFDCGKKGVFEISLFEKDAQNLEPIMKSFKC